MLNVDLMANLRRIPSVDSLLRHAGMMPILAQYGRVQVIDAIHTVLENLRRSNSKDGINPSLEDILQHVDSLLADRNRSTLLPVINATGVILHTNLGRAQLCREAVQAVTRVAAEYSTLEYDLARGERGSRSDHARDLLCRITGAEDALAVNNNAGGVLLCLSALAARKKVAISRSQLVEIGGGFRIPDVMKQSGARLVEIGTTNRVSLVDYETVINEGASLILRVHSSNFKLVGFTTQPSLEEIVSLAHHYNVPVLDDIGSGALLDTSVFGLAHEPMVQESIKTGVDLVCFSGDKLLGGPQAGIIVGRKELVEKIKKHPLARALRIDKMNLAGLTSTLQHYLVGDAPQAIPVWRMIACSPENLKLRAEVWRSAIGSGEVIEERSTVGGGSLPEETLPTYVLTLDLPHVKDFAARLRQSNPPLICRVQNGKALFDPRTVMEAEDEKFIEILKSNLARSKA